MMKGSSNRMTQIKVVEGGKVVKTIANTAINYGQDLDQLKKMIEIAIRLSPQDPVYTADKLMINVGKGKDMEMDPDELEQFQMSLFKQEVAPGAKIMMTVHVQRPNGSGATATPSRPTSMRLNNHLNLANLHANNNENQENKYDNILFSPTQAKRSTTPGKGRATTPGKGRASSRGRGQVAPAVARTPNLHSAVKLNNYLRTMNDEESAEAVNSLASFVSNNSPEKTTSVVPADQVQLESKHMEVPSGQDVVSPVDDQMQNLNAMMTALDVSTPMKANDETKKSKRLSVVEIKAIETSINDTWQEVGDDTEECTPTRTLAPFQYYSDEEGELPSDNEEEDQGREEQPNSVRLTEQSLQESIEDVSASHVCDTTASMNPSIMSTPEAKPSAVCDGIAINSDSTPCPSASEDKVMDEDNKTNSLKTPSKTPSKKPHNSVVSSATKSVKKVTTASASLYPGPKKPVYPEGHTLGESSVKYELNLRSYNGASIPGSATKVKKNHLLPQPQEQQSPQINFKMSSCKKGEDGRPSIGTITQQWEFMRINFVNNSDEELEWLMVSKKPGSYAYAHRKNEVSEDKYFRSLYEVQFYESKIAFFAGSSAKLPALVSELNGYYNPLMDTPKCEVLETKIMTAYTKFINEFESLKKQKAFEAFLTNAAKIEESLVAISQETTKFRIVTKAKEAYPGLANEIFQLQKKLTQARKDGDEALKNMEKWSRREMEVEEYPVVMRQQEEKWMEEEYVDNLEALDTMRRYLPTNITDISVNDLQELYRQQNGCISLELAQELKSNKFLHWLVTHPDDIAYANFLTGENKTYFENLESMDLTELRALALVMPSKFELDGDGKKNEWRTRFFARLKQLISQFRHDKVKGAWDPNLKARTMVELPPLKPDLLRRPIYYYRTKEQSDQKLKQYDDKLALLAKKEKWLETAEKEAKDAKEEYDTVLKEMRDPDFIEMYGAEKLASVKEMAKTEWTSAEKKRKTLFDDVSRLKKSIENAPVTREQFIEKEKEVENYLSDRGVNWTEKGQNPIMIYGPFEAEKVLEKKVKAAAKFLSAEEEAAIRKKELEKLKAAKEELEVSQTPQEIAVPIVTDGNNEIINRSNSEDDAHPVPKKLCFPFVVAEATNNNNCSHDISLASSDGTQLSSDLLRSTGEGAFETPKPSKKRSILTHTNPELLNTLNKMFGGQAPPPGTTPAKTPNRRFSVAITGSSAKGGALFMNTDSTTEADIKKDVNKKSKSKLLQKLLGEDKPKQDPFSSTGGFPLPPRPAMSFLDQLKARAGGGGTEGELPAAPRLNPFAAASCGGGGGMSFLDQIKARRKGNDDGNNTACESAAQPPEAVVGDNEVESAPKPMRGPMGGLFGNVPAGGGMSFLDQIKSRRKE